MKFYNRRQRIQFSQDFVTKKLKAYFAFAAGKFYSQQILNFGPDVLLGILISCQQPEDWFFGFFKNPVGTISVGIRRFPFPVMPGKAYFKLGGKVEFAGFFFSKRPSCSPSKWNEKASSAASSGMSSVPASPSRTARPA